MIVSTWNIRGLNKPFKQKELVLFLKKYKVEVMGLVETRVKENKAKRIAQKIAKDWKVQYNYNCAYNGRIWLLWKPHIHIQILMVDAQFVHCEVEEQISQKKWLFTVVYAYNELNTRWQLWKKLIGIGSNIISDWLISGYFNNVLLTDDRIGAPITLAEVQEFKEFLDKMQLTPLKSTGCWMMNNGHIEAENLNPGVSDHSPILMNCQTGIIQQHLYPRPFRLYHIVLRHPEFTRIVKEVWMQNDRDIGKARTWYKLKRLKESLRSLNNYMESYQRKPNQAKQKLELVQHQLFLQPLRQECIEQEKEALLEVEKWIDIEEQVLRQKSRATWIQHGDGNTKYFHAQWKMRTNTNAIVFIQNDAGIKLTDPKQMEEKFLDFFKKLMGESSPLHPCPDAEVIKKGPCLTRQQQLELIKAVTEEEII
ncbi:PREDICTED: uncharacterized protein LOC109227587 [Nicotiana attenuata]|uniref:uncharacterized protein LOC109227587 n=1 Tax=Nicotiana attenuata TaxID=49451 RepID=UPI00090485C0|nr:PREDICTED: uncharacterized protein LOC109227587 [Nicotiana attenuata]